MNICSFSAVVLHALDVNQAYHSRLPTQFPEADFERDLMHILSVHFDSLEFSLEFLQHHTMLVIQKTRLVKRYVEEQHPIIFQNISDWLLRMFRQHQKIKKQRERDYQTPEKKEQLKSLFNQKQRQRRAELSREQKMQIQQKDRQQHRQRRAALSPEKKRQVNQEQNNTITNGSNTQGNARQIRAWNP